MALLAVTALTAGCSSAGGSQPDGGGSYSPARNVNQSLTLDQLDGSALVTLVSVSESFESDGVTADSGNFVAVTMKFENKSGTYMANPLYVRLRKADGKIVDKDDLAVPLALSLGGDNKFELAAGKTIAGTVAFDVAYDPQDSIVVTDPLGRVRGNYPLSGDKPIPGDGSKKRAINKSQTARQRDSSAIVTLVSVSESTGSLNEATGPESGHLVVVELKVQGKSGEFTFDSTNVKLKTPDGKVIKDSDGGGGYGVPTKESINAADDVTAGKTATGKVAFDTPLQPGSHILITDAWEDKTIADFPL